MRPKTGLPSELGPRGRPLLSGEPEIVPMQRDWMSRAVLLMAVALLAIAAFGVWLRFRPVPYQTERWLTSGGFDRGRMLSSLMAQTTFDKFPRADVEHYLGRPDFDERQFWYDLGPADPDRRTATLSPSSAWTARLDRLAAIVRFLDTAPAAGDPATRAVAYLQGDASPRSYARITSAAPSVVLMDAPRQPDGPPIRDGLPYSRIAHLAEDMVRPFSALSGILRTAGLSAPEILAGDLDRGFLLIEDLGDHVFSSEIAQARTQQGELWRSAVDALVELGRAPVIREVVSRGSANGVPLPAYDRQALQIEVELLLDWYWPAVHGAQAREGVRAEYLDLWEPLFRRLEHQAPSLVLRDYHSPNLIWLPAREGIRRVGIIDFQDAQLGSAAYDLVSLLQDARVDVPETLEKDLLEHYLRAAKVRDSQEFRFAYSALGAQRSTKILGIFVRLARRDGKRSYLAHLPRIWGYLERNLANVALAPLAAWYDRHFPVSLRKGLPA